MKMALPAEDHNWIADIGEKFPLIHKDAAEWVGSRARRPGAKLEPVRDERTTQPS